MIAIADSTFKAAGITSDAEKLFVSLWAELFHPYTIDTYRVRVMNASTILTELRGVIFDRQEEEIAATNLQFVSQEANRIITNDFILS